MGPFIPQLPPWDDPIGWLKIVIPILLAANQLLIYCNPWGWGDGNVAAVRKRLEKRVDPRVESMQKENAEIKSMLAELLKQRGGGS